MDVSDLVRRLLRRWLAVLLIVVLAVVAAGLGWVRTGQTRQTVAAVVIVPPKYGDEVPGQNPLLNLDNNLAQLATVLAEAMQSDDVGAALARNGATGSFTVSTVTGTNPSFSQLSPQLQFTVTGDTARQTLFSARTLVSQARIQLAALQDRAGVSANARATLVESAEPTSAEAVSGSRLRVAGSLGLGVLVLGLLALLVIDGLLARRRSRAADGAGPSLAASVDDDDEAERSGAADANPVLVTGKSPVAEPVTVEPPVADESAAAEPVAETEVADTPDEPEPARKAPAKRAARKTAAKRAPAKTAAKRQPARKRPAETVATRDNSDGDGAPGSARAAANGTVDHPARDGEYDGEQDTADTHPLRAGR